jgi:hypothetical protein
MNKQPVICVMRTLLHPTPAPVNGGGEFLEKGYMLGFRPSIYPFSRPTPLPVLGRGDKWGKDK